MLSVSLYYFCFVFLRLVHPILSVSLDCFCFVFLRLVHPILSVSLGCLFFIAPLGILLRLVFRNIKISQDPDGSMS
jgi:hypothetical protein